MVFVTYSESCIEIYGFNGSDVTNVIFYSLYSSVVSPSRCVLELIVFTCHDMRLSSQTFLKNA